MLLKIIITTLIIEMLTLFGRFGLGLQATRDTTILAKFTFGFRIHHGYIGLLLLVIVYCLSLKTPLKHDTALYVVGASLLLSDILHHLLLWLITGDPELHIKY
jgi:hypothetical protein